MIIELVGPAGAGKSTLAKNLVAGSSRISKLSIPSTDKPRNIPFFIRSMIALVPGYLSLPRKTDRKLSRRELAWLLILTNWSRKLMKTLDDKKLYVIDQGPVFLLTSLYYFGPSFLQGPSASKFWQSIFLDWARVLDLIVLLDAPNECLYQRIINRPKSHLQLDYDQAVVYDFLDEWRRGYDEVTQKLAAQSPSPKILRINTENAPMNRLCRLVKLEIIAQTNKHDSHSQNLSQLRTIGRVQ